MIGNGHGRKEIPVRCEENKVAMKVVSHWRGCDSPVSKACETRCVDAWSILISLDLLLARGWSADLQRSSPSSMFVWF